MYTISAGWLVESRIREYQIGFIEPKKKTSHGRYCTDPNKNAKHSGKKTGTSRGVQNEDIKLCHRGESEGAKNETD
jgi:hypothetical protein